MGGIDYIGTGRIGVLLLARVACTLLYICFSVFLFTHMFFFFVFWVSSGELCTGQDGRVLNCKRVKNKNTTARD